jgi:hypothetical protein
MILNDFMKKMHFGIYLGDYNIGIRQRIIFMMSYGVPVLCHINNKDSLLIDLVKRTGIEIT